MSRQRLASPVDISALDAPNTSRDALLADLLEQLLTASRAGRASPLQRMLQAHPDLADELTQLWAAAQMADDLASGFSGEMLELAPVSGVYLKDFPQTFGEYELLEEIGRGGMGIVYKARQVNLGRIVAIKRVLRGDLASPSDLERLRAEAAAAAQLDHPHIVPVYEVGECDGQPFFSMKYVAGTTLSVRLAEGPLPPREAAQLMIPVCRAIAAAHQRGVLHRDLKPSNILIDPQGVPHVTDFGLAKRFHSGRESSTGDSPNSVDPRRQLLTLSGAILGTPSYMAPEQAAGQRGEITPASDVYSLGAVLYQCVTGRPPFQAANPVDVLLMVLEQDPLLPRLINSAVDRDLEMIVLKCLQKPAELRYSSPADLADDLQAWLANEPISARSTNLGQLVSRMLRETHHAVVLEHWGLLWMWHSLVLLVLCLVTNAFQFAGVTQRLPYLGLWVLGLGLWAAIFWTLRHRSGPITFVERQVAHVWAASMGSSMLLFAIEQLLGLDVLTLSPVLALIAASVFLVKAGILSGAFYVQAIVLFATALVMAAMRRPHQPDWALTVYGVVSALCFFIPGLKYARQRQRGPVA